MTETRPTSEQLRFVSSQTGEHILDAYLESAERGGRTLPDLLADLFASNGQINSSLFQFRLDPATSFLQVRNGTFTDPNAGWLDIPDGRIFRQRGPHATATAYARLDIATHNNIAYVCETPHTSTTAAPHPTNFRILIDGSSIGAVTSITSTDLAVSGTSTVALALNTVPVTKGGTGATTQTQARANLEAAKSGSNSDITALSGLTTALSVAQGGTGATTQTQARANLEAAKSGSNSDITSITGLTTALSIPQGGTGQTSAAAAINALLPTQTGNAGRFLSTNGAAPTWQFVDLAGTFFTYANRAQIRALDAPQDRRAVIEGLGLFVWEPGSTEPDDDETCFATTTGRWLLHAASWDIAFAYWLPDIDDAQGRIESIENRTLYGTAVCGISSVSGVSSTTFTATIPGAALNDIAITSPRGVIGSDQTADTARLTYSARVSAPDTVTITIGNPSASTATLSTAAQGTWDVVVIKRSVA